MRLLLAIFLAMSLMGCATFRKPQKGTSAPTVAKQEQKDSKIVSAADQIDVLAAPTEIAEPVKAQTDAIRAAVKEAPAADVAALTKSLEQRAVRAEKQALEAEYGLHRTIRLSLAGIGFILAAITVAGGLMFAKFAVLFSWFGRDVLLLTAALSGLSWFSSIAYGWAIRYQNWLMGGAAVVVLLVGALIYSNIRHDRLSKQ